MSGFFRFDQMRILASYEHASLLAPSHVLGVGDTSPMLAWRIALAIQTVIGNRDVEDNRGQRHP